MNPCLGFKLKAAILAASLGFSLNASAQPVCAIFDSQAELEQRIENLLKEFLPDLDTNKPRDILKLTETAVAFAPHSAHAWIARAKALLSYHAYDDALNAVRSALRLGPDDILTLEQSAHYLIKLGLFDVAKHVIARGLNKYPTDTSLLVQQLMLAFAQGDAEEASIAFNKVPMSARTRESYIQLISILRADGYSKEALPVAQEALTRWPGDANFLYYLGTIHAHLLQDSAAIAVLERRVEVRAYERSDESWVVDSAEREQDVEATLALSRLHERAGRKRDSVSVLKVEVEFYPDNVRLLRKLQKTLLSLHEIEAASKVADRILSDIPDCSLSLTTKAQQSLRTGKPLQAMAFLDQMNPAFTNKRDLEIAKTLRVKSLNLSGQFDQSLALLEEAERAPENLWLKAMAYYGKGNDGLAIQALREHISFVGSHWRLSFAAILRIVGSKNLPVDLHEMWVSLTEEERGRVRRVTDDLKRHDSPMKRAWQVRAQEDAPSSLTKSDY